MTYNVGGHVTVADMTCKFGGHVWELCFLELVFLLTDTVVVRLIDDQFS